MFRVCVGVCASCWCFACGVHVEVGNVPVGTCKRPRVCLRNTRVLDTHVSFCRHTRGRFEHTHGDADKHGTRLPLFLLPSRPPPPPPPHPHTRFGMASQSFLQALFRYCSTAQRGIQKDAQRQSSALQRLAGPGPDNLTR